MSTRSRSTRRSASALLLSHGLQDDRDPWLPAMNRYEPHGRQSGVRGEGCSLPVRRRNQVGIGLPLQAFARVALLAFDRQVQQSVGEVADADDPALVGAVERRPRGFFGIEVEPAASEDPVGVQLLFRFEVANPALGQYALALAVPLVLQRHANP